MNVSPMLLSDIADMTRMSKPFDIEVADDPRDPWTFQVEVADLVSDLPPKAASREGDSLPTKRTISKRRYRHSEDHPDVSLPYETRDAAPDNEDSQLHAPTSADGKVPTSSNERLSSNETLPLLKFKVPPRLTSNVRPIMPISASDEAGVDYHVRSSTRRCGCIGPYYSEDTLLCLACQRKYDDSEGYIQLHAGDPVEMVSDGYFYNGKDRLLRIEGLLGQGTFGNVFKVSETYAINSPRISGNIGKQGQQGMRLKTIVDKAENLGFFGLNRSGNCSFEQKDGPVAQNTFAMKVIRNIPKYRRAARKEIAILLDLQNSPFTTSYSHDSASPNRSAASRSRSGAPCHRPTQGKSCIPLLVAFEYRHHICLLFPLLSIDLYSLLESTKFIGLVRQDVRDLGKHLFQMLEYLKSKGIIHSDLKPENIMLLDKSYRKVTERSNASAPSSAEAATINERSLNGSDSVTGCLSNAIASVSVDAPDSLSRERQYCVDEPVLRTTLMRNSLQVIDFGSALYVHESHPSLVSTRHYRAPEVLLGLPYSFEIDVWSLACILLELRIGTQVFTTHSDLEHLALIGALLKQDGTLNEDLVIPDYMAVLHRTSTLRTRGPRRPCLLKHVSSLLDLPLSSSNPLKLDVLFPSFEDIEFKDLVRRCLKIDPRCRITPEEALQHPYFKQLR